MVLGACVGREEPPNTALQLTNTDAAHSALRSPCLLSVLAAECHVGLSQGTPSTASVASTRDGTFRSSMDHRGASAGAAEHHLLGHGTFSPMDTRFDVTDQRNSRQQKLFGGAGLPYTGTSVHWFLRLQEALHGPPRLRYAATSVHGLLRFCRKLHSPPGLRCAGTSVHWPLRWLEAPQSAGTSVRRDFGAPGLRCAGTSVHRGGRETHLRRRQPRFLGQVARSWRPSPENPPKSPDLAASRPMDPPRSTPAHLRAPHEKTHRQRFGLSRAPSDREHFC